MMSDPEDVPAFEDKNSCIYQDQVYPEESHVCGHQICIICKEGEWEELPVD
jgi:hypothetical protein